MRPELLWALAAATDAGELHALRTRETSPARPADPPGVERAGEH